MGGLPGTGKSTVAGAIGAAIGAPVIARDVVEASLWRSDVTAEHGSRPAANDLLITLADTFLDQGVNVVIDSVFGLAADRDRLAQVAAEHDTPFRLIECSCVDEEVHRTRLTGRRRGIEGWYELEWSDVEATRARYAAWDEQRLVLDAARPLDENVASALDYLQRG